MWNDLGRPDWFAIDFRPMKPPLLVMATHELAERFTKASKKFPYSYSKAVTYDLILDAIGPRSILVKEVKGCYCALVWCRR